MADVFQRHRPGEEKGHFQIEDDKQDGHQVEPHVKLAARVAEGRDQLSVVDDQRGTPTTCRCLARQLQAAVEGGWRGLFHTSCAGETTWHGFAAEIFRQAGVSAELRPCTTAEYPLPAPRPAYSVLDNTRRRAAGPDLMPDWREALAEVLEETE